MAQKAPGNRSGLFLRPWVNWKPGTTLIYAVLAK
jgi:hypothetical protein